jgi:hypothetical protein
MPHLDERDDEIVITARKFSVAYNRDDPHFFTVVLPFLSQKFFIPAGCDSVEKMDLNRSLIEVKCQASRDRVQMELHYVSSLWRKTYFIVVFDDHLSFFYEVVGCHSLSTVRFFEGIWESGFTEDFFTVHFNDRKRTPYREYSSASPVGFDVVFTPEPNVYDRRYSESFESALISVNSDFQDYRGGNFYFNPGILCFLVSSNDRRSWLSLGLAVPPGEHLFSDYEYIGGTHFGLSLNYCNARSVDGTFRTPQVVMFVGGNEVATLGAYVQHLQKEQLTPAPASQKESWWRGPIICPVGHQYYQTDLFRVRSPKERSEDTAGYFACTQVNCEEFVRRIDEGGLDWRIFVIDVKWFINAGQKAVDIGRWPDMRGFVDNIHKRGKRVIIWWSPWDTEGWCKEDCITFSSGACGEQLNRPGKLVKWDKVMDGVKLAPDITLPRVREMVTLQLKALLGSEGMDIDGLKIDHSAATPGVFGLVFPTGSQQLYGIELMRYYQSYLYDTVKAIKSDALVIGQAANPYFADCIDMVRLGDTYSRLRDSIVDMMRFRAQMARLANPGWLIDMDGWPMPSVAALREYASFQTDTGVPTFCYVSHLDTTGDAIPPELLSQIRIQWDEYINKWYTAQEARAIRE